MASLTMHAVIANEYCKRHVGINYKEFSHGNLAPDLAADKNKSHFTKPSMTQELDENIKNKVGLTEYVDSHSLDNDFELGAFLHMLTDYIFYNHALRRDVTDFKLLSLQESIKFLYDDFARVNGFLADHYNIDLMLLPENCWKVSKEKPISMSFDEITNFIEHCANLDLEKEYKKIKNKKLPGYPL